MDLWIDNSSRDQGVIIYREPITSIHVLRDAEKDVIHKCVYVLYTIFFGHTHAHG